MSARHKYPLLLGLAGAALFWERLWRRLWPAAAVAGLFLGVALLDLLPLLPGAVHVLVLVAFAAGIAALARRGLRGFRLVDEAAARHRLERDSGLRHRPLTALDDRLATGAEDPAAVSLWQAHLRRMARAARRLRVRPPAPGLARLDPHAFRAAVLLILVIALTAGRGDAADRLQRALSPQFGGALTGPLTVDVWITPPSYTGRAPIFLNRDSQWVVEVPKGSSLLAQVGGLGEAPRLRVGERVTEFTAIGSAGGGGYRVEAAIDEGDRLVVEHDGRELAAWPLRVLPDAPPEVYFPRPPARTGNAHLRLDYEANDDYGLTGVTAVIRRADGLSVPGGESEIRLSLPLSDLGSTSAEGTSIHNLTAHPWAGLVVRVHLTVMDGRGQTGESGTVELALPERIFNHPVARAIVEQRKKLATPSAAVRAEVAAALESIAGNPQHFFDDTVVYLALRVARARLTFDDRDEAVVSVQKLLWDTALRIEDGELSIAERDLREAQERLMAALRRDADPEEIERLMDDLQRALEKYLAALTDELTRQGRAMEVPLGAKMQLMGKDELQQLIEEARELARTGAVDAARRVLADLQRLLDGIRAGALSGPSQEAARKARRLMDGLRDLTRRQQGLLDNTFRRLRDSRGAMQMPGGGEGQGPERRPGAGNGTAEQDGLRRRLGGLMLRLDEFLGAIPRPFGKAERAMRDAVDALAVDRPDKAVPAQTEALDQLRQGIDGVAEQVVRRLGGLSGALRNRPGAGRDPFGRRPGGAYGARIDGAVKIPDQMEVRRAREIIDELRRRAGERQRPKTERNYIERLLRQF